MPKKPPHRWGHGPSDPHRRNWRAALWPDSSRPPGDRVRLVLRATISRAAAEAISAAAITQEVNFATGGRGDAGGGWREAEEASELMTP
jgi:hypothetical protein